MSWNMHLVAIACAYLVFTVCGRRLHLARDRSKSELARDNAYRAQVTMIAAVLPVTSPTAAFKICGLHFLKGNVRMEHQPTPARATIRCSAVTVDSGSTQMLCTPGTLSSRIEQAVCSVYGAAGTERVRLSLKRLSEGTQLNRKVNDMHELMVQEANSYIESLTPQPWHDASKFKWAQQLEKKWKVVRDELRSQLDDEKALIATGQNVWGSLDASIAEYGTGWKTLPLCDRTVWDPVNSALFPKTCELLHKCKVPLIEAFFAKMEPESDIKPHSDMCNFVLTSHLGLIVPEGQCDLTVGNETHGWRNGQVMMFDTSILHAAENRAKTERHILMLRVYHPELTKMERSALQLVFDCLDEQELLDDREALSEYELRRRAVEAESRKPWEQAAAQSKLKNKRRR